MPAKKCFRYFPYPTGQNVYTQNTGATYGPGVLLYLSIRSPLLLINIRLFSNHRLCLPLSCHLNIIIVQYLYHHYIKLKNTGIGDTNL